MYQERAISKLQQELKAFQSNDNKAKAVKDAVADALIDFCKQDDEFAQAIVQSDKTLSDCCNAAMKGVGNSISDLEVFKKAVKFYFSTADIQFKMTIDLCGNIGESEKTGKVIELSFDELFSD